MQEPKFVKPSRAEEAIGLCLESFSKEESKKRILEYVDGLVDIYERQFQQQKEFYKREIQKLEKQINSPS